jgi:hypothetical protein
MNKLLLMVVGSVVSIGSFAYDVEKEGRYFADNVSP